jgi:hypothetical protein
MWQKYEFRNRYISVVPNLKLSESLKLIIINVVSTKVKTIRPFKKKIPLHYTSANDKSRKGL